MDDLRIFAKGRAALQRVVGKMDGVSGAIGMVLGLSKCAVAHVFRGRVMREGRVKLPSRGEITEVEDGGSYKYLSVAQLVGANLLETKVGRTE